MVGLCLRPNSSRPLGWDVPERSDGIPEAPNEDGLHFLPLLRREADVLLVVVCGFHAFDPSTKPESRQVDRNGLR